MLEKEMCLNKKLILITYFIFFKTFAYADFKENIINNLKNTQNMNFDFEQNINGKIEKGNCTIQYPKKIFCKYDLESKKILVSDGNTLVITNKFKSYYKYPLSKTPLDYILDKKFLLQEIKNLKERVIDNQFINFTIFKNENEINLFFDKKYFNLIGWQTLDIYQNLNITHISSIKKNQNIKNEIFKIPLKD